MQDRDGLAAFCEREHPRLVRSLTAFCGDQALAEEIAQETLVRACQHWRKLRRMELPGAWVHRVAINLANSTFRRRAAERRALSRAHMAEPQEDVDVPELLLLRASVGRLGRRRREVLVLRHVGQLSVAETATAMGISENAVRSLTSRALGELREAMTTEPEAPRAR